MTTSPRMPDHAVSYSIILNRLGRSDESIERLTAASRELHAAGSRLWALSADYHLARALMLSGRYDESLKLLEEVRRAWSENPTANKDRLADLARTQRRDRAGARTARTKPRELIDASLAQFGYPSANIALGLTAALTMPPRESISPKDELPAGGVVCARLHCGSRKRSPGTRRRAPTSAKRRSCSPRSTRPREIGRRRGRTSTWPSKRSRNGLGSDHPLTREAVALQAALRE